MNTFMKKLFGKSTPAPAGFNPQLLEPAAKAQAKAYGASGSVTESFKTVQATLVAAGQCNLQDPATHARLAERLTSDIQAQHPFSLLRIGDGEGDVLFWTLHAKAFPELAQYCMGKILRLMFGRFAPAANAWDRFAATVHQAVQGATYLGFPTPNQANMTLQALADPFGDGFDVRGKIGVVAVWDWLGRQPEAWLSKPDTVWVNWHVHKSLLDILPGLIKTAGMVSVISCHPEVLGLLHDKNGVAKGRAILIPPQASSAGADLGEFHYPGAFDKICSDLERQDLTGELFLVGAGWLGKYYCDLIRRRGGMAIDVGSMMDVWVGKSARRYQTAEFIEKHRL